MINTKRIKKFVFAISLIFIATISMACASRVELENQERLISAIELPHSIEFVSIKSAIGDSGGNGNYSTLRTVMLVRTDLTISELREFFIENGFRLGEYNRETGYPSFVVRETSSYQFNSSRAFKLEFEELKSVDDFSRYYFIEFIG